MERLKRFFKRLLWFFAIVLVLIACVLAFRVQILRGIGNYLVVEDSMLPSDAIFMLAGSPVERAIESAKLFRQQHASIVVASGGSVNVKTTLLGLPMMEEARWDSIALVQQHISSQSIKTLPEGTSTLEEANAIKDYCLANKFHRIIIVSSLHHTLRVSKVFDSVCKPHGIEVLVKGSTPLDYKPQEWWNYESGLLMVNNEYVKLIWYKLQYGI